MAGFACAKLSPDECLSMVNEGFNGDPSGPFKSQISQKQTEYLRLIMTYYGPEGHFGKKCRAASTIFNIIQGELQRRDGLPKE